MATSVSVFWMDPVWMDPVWIDPAWIDPAWMDPAWMDSARGERDRLIRLTRRRWPSARLRVWRAYFCGQWSVQRLRLRHSQQRTKRMRFGLYLAVAVPASTLVVRQ